jgi:hypothetical protein
MKHRLFFLLLIFYSTCLLSQTGLKHDSAYIQPRSFNKNALAEFKNQKDFQYNQYKEPPLSLWNKFWNWVWWNVGRLLSTKQGRLTVWSILIIAGIAVIIFFIIKITGMDQDGLFGRGSKGLQTYTVSGQDINEISFDSEIEKAVNEGNFRLAIRLQYLQALKKLSDKGYIDWRINKTNTDYHAEISGKPFNDTFKKLTHNFEYIWYGEQPVSNEQFLEIRHQFQKFNNQVL